MDSKPQCLTLFRLEGLFVPASGEGQIDGTLVVLAAP